MNMQWNWLNRIAGVTLAALIALGCNEKLEPPVCDQDGVTVQWQATTKRFDMSTVLGLVANADGHIFVMMPNPLSVTGAGGIFRSTDNGQSWQVVHQFDSNDFAEAGMAISNSGVIYGMHVLEGVVRSEDNGDTWSKVFTPANTALSEVVVGANNQVFITTAINGKGIYRSANGVDDWQNRATGLPADGLLTLAAAPDGTLYAGGFSNTIYRSGDNGDTWTATGLAEYSVGTIAFGANGEVFAGTSQGVFVSTDGGASWTARNSGLANTLVRALAVDEVGKLYAATSGRGVFKTINNGECWWEVNNGLSLRFVTTLFIDANGRLYAGTAGDGVFRTTN